jgi:hypothetical protein
MTNEQAALRKVIWLDSAQVVRWHGPEDATYGPVKVTTVGWVLEETDEYIVLSSSVVFGDDYQAADAMSIPKVCIINDKKLNAR